MQVSERRKKILDIFLKKGSLSYKEILDETSGLGAFVDILSDLDILVFFRFLQKIKSSKKPKFTPETVLELRPTTKDQIKDDPSRIDARLRKIEHEIPPWYRKLAILKIFVDEPLDFEEIKTAIKKQYPHVRWFPPLVQASLKILKRSKHVITTTNDDESYALTSKGKELLEKSPFQQFSHLRKLKNEFTAEFRTYAILDFVRAHDTFGISSGRITRHLQLKYGIRGNKRQSIRSTLNNMVIAGLLSVSGGTEEREGHVYHLSRTVKSLFSSLS